jgi:hypothetical protein
VRNNTSLMRTRLVPQWKEGDTTQAHCISCNGCFRPGTREGGTAYVIEKMESKKERPVVRINCDRREQEVFLPSSYLVCKHPLPVL